MGRNSTNGNRTSVAPASGGGSAVISAYNRVTDDGTYTYQYDKVSVPVRE